MKSSLLSICFIFLITMLCRAQPTNINISLTSAFEGEPYLAINPTNPQNIVVAWMAEDLSTGAEIAIKSKTSFDGGATWGNTFIQPHFGTSWGSADVSMQFRNNGTLYLSYIDYRQSPDTGGVYIAHSLNGGIAWSSPTQVWNALVEDPTKLPLDRPWLVADNSNTANDGMFYITTKPPSWIAPPNRPYLKTSADSGLTWSTYRYVDTANYLVGNLIAAPMAAPVITADGAFCAGYPSYVATQSIFPVYYFAKSYNRGASFQYYDLIVNPTGLPTADSSYKAGYHLAANPVNANQLALVYLGNQNGDPDVFVTTTNDGGVTWSTSVRVNDDAIGNGVGQDMPWASYESNGNLVVVWRDRRNGTGTGYNQNSDTYCAVSGNNGVTFNSNVRLSSTTATFAPILLQKGNDFMSCQLLNDTIYAAWGDTRTGFLNIFFAKGSVSTGNASAITTINPEDAEAISMYPNPTSEKLFIKFNSSEYKKIVLSIIDEKGNNVYKSEIENSNELVSIALPKMAKGAYIINAAANNNIIYKNKLLVY